MNNYPEGLRILETKEPIPRREQLRRRNDEVRRAIWEIRNARETLRLLRQEPLVPTRHRIIELMPGETGYRDAKPPHPFFESERFPRTTSYWSSLVKD